MREHFISLFDNTHKKKTIYFFIIAALFIIISLSVGISDNLPMIAMLLTGIIFLFFAVLHPWKKVGNYGILVGVCVGILLMEFLGITVLSKVHKTEYINEGIAMSLAFFICVPGILVGMIGAIICAIRKK